MAERRSPIAGFAPRFKAANAYGNLRLGEIPFLSHVNLRVAPESSAAGKVALALDLPLPTEPGSVARSDELSVLWLGPDEWLVIGAAGTQRELVDRLEIAAGADHASIVDVSAQRTTLLVAGARARDVLAHGCTLDLHPRTFDTDRCAQTLLARAHVVLINRDAEESTFWVLCCSSIAPYLATWLLDAATEYLSGEPGQKRPMPDETINDHVP